jgi:drug/metabolite transporter (DMT)-like permease
MVVALAVAAAFLFALGTVLQQRAAVREPSGGPRGAASLLVRLVRRPMWIGGIVVDGLGFAAQAAALGVGRLAVVQPILAATVVFALPLGAWLTNQRIRAREWAAAGLVTAALVAFLVVANATGGRDDAPLGEWLVAAIPIGAVSAALVAAGWRARPGVKAALLGTAAGILFGVSAALTKATVDQLDEGVLHLVLDWHIYALLAVGYAGMTVSQVSLQTGVLAPAISTASILDPITSVALGVTLFEESLHDDAAGVAATILALGVMFAGLIVLARSEGSRHEPDAPGGGEARQ